jgi:hypothetical protein
MHEYTEKIRDFINEPRARYALLKNLGLWHQLCSALDVVEDSDLAIASFSAGEFPATDGARYLAVYGLLQALFLQQDAVFNICESLGIPEKLESYPGLKEIREIRNASTGHPTKKERPKSQPTSYHFISRPTLTLNGFELHSSYGDGTIDFKSISIPELIAEQRRYVSHILGSVVTELKRREAAHKEKFKMEKLASLFPPSLRYALSKILESTGRADLAPVGEVSLKSINQTLQAFREALQKRGIELDTYDSINHIYAELQYPIAELERFFQSTKAGEQPNINEKTAYIFAFFVRAQFDELKQMAQEIDDYYSAL